MAFHTCRNITFNDPQGKRVSKDGDEWSCKPCAYKKVKALSKALQRIKFDWFITFNSGVPFKPPVKRILDIGKAMTSMKNAINYKYGRGAYLIGFGTTRTNLIHAHMLRQGKIKPNLKWLKDKWKKFSGFHDVHIKPAHEGHVEYIGKNVSRLPAYHLRASGFSYWDSKLLKHYRRIRKSVGLIPPKKKKGQAKSGYKYMGTRLKWTDPRRVVKWHLNPFTNKYEVNLY